MKKFRSFLSLVMIAVLLVALVSIYGCRAAVSPQMMAAQTTMETPVAQNAAETLITQPVTETQVVQPTSETPVAQLTTLALDAQPTTPAVIQPPATTQVIQTTTTTPAITLTAVTPIIPPISTTTNSVTDTPVLTATINEALLAEVRSKAEQPAPGIYYIDAATAKNLADNTKVIILDARYLVDYDKLHLAGAISLPVSSVWQNFIDPVTVIPDKEAIYIAYCSPGCPAGLELAQELAARGYHNLFVLLGGYLYWQQAGYPMVIKS